MIEEHLIERARRVSLLVMDCDGVLTDGRLYFTADGEAMKVFNVRDGQGLALWHRAGFRSGIISGRGSGEIIRRRADELGIEFVVVSSTNKLRDLETMMDAAGVSAEETAFVGDDVGDIEVVKRAGFGVAVADAVPALQEAADHVTNTRGGKGAVRELIDALLAVKA